MENTIHTIVNFWTPFYINFYVTWYRAKRDNLLPVKFFSFEDMLKDKQAFFTDILNYYEITPNKSLAEDIVATEKNREANRMNRGITGRGESIPQYLMDNIKKLASFYPDVDFSPNGIG